MFTLDDRLVQDTIYIGDFKLSALLLSRDANYPWFILVPRREGVTEICDLPETEQMQLLRESSFLCRCLRTWFDPYKLNVAALGNVVPQLHLHHIVRYREDPAWPAPVWGKCPPAVWPPADLERVLQYFDAISDAPQAIPFARQR